MDIESECYPCIPMSSAIQLNAASLIGNHHLSNSTLTSPSSSISSISSLCNSSLSSTTNSQSTNKSDAQFTPGRRGRKSKQQQANIIVTNCNSVNKQANKSQNESAAKNSTLTALLNCSPLISTANGKTSSQFACNLPPTPPASNSDSDCEINSHSNNDRARNSDKPSGKPGRPSSNQHNDASSKQVKRPRANNCSILVQSGTGVINLTQQLSPSSLKHLTVNTASPNSIEVNSNHSSASYSPSSSNYHLMNGGLKLDASSNLVHTSSAATHRSHRVGIQSMASLISCQPKTAASGTPVILTEEEKRTLIAEGNYRPNQGRRSL